MKSLKVKFGAYPKSDNGYQCENKINLYLDDQFTKPPIGYCMVKKEASQFIFELNSSEEISLNYFVTACIVPDSHIYGILISEKPVSNFKVSDVLYKQ